MNEYPDCFVKQTIEHDPEKGNWGNCFSAVLASLLDIPIEDVPVFSGDGWLLSVNEFLRDYDLAFMYIDNLPEALKAYGIAGLWHEVSGETGRNTFHSCVAHDGQLVFDPHKSNAGLTATTDYGVFVALNPAKAKTCKAQN